MTSTQTDTNIMVSNHINIHNQIWNRQNTNIVVQEFSETQII